MNNVNGQTVRTSPKGFSTGIGLARVTAAAALHLSTRRRGIRT